MNSLVKYWLVESDENLHKSYAYIYIYIYIYICISTSAAVSCAVCFIKAYDIALF